MAEPMTRVRLLLRYTEAPFPRLLDPSSGWVGGELQGDDDGRCVGRMLTVEGRRPNVHLGGDPALAPSADAFPPVAMSRVVIELLGPDESKPSIELVEPGADTAYIQIEDACRLDKIDGRVWWMVYVLPR